jgi:hypothetical protein
MFGLPARSKLRGLVERDCVGAQRLRQSTSVELSRKTNVQGPADSFLVADRPAA